jgi:hypothetical protein
MIDRSLIETACEHVGRPRKNQTRAVVNGYTLPDAYGEILQIANGFSLKQSAFRFFGIGTTVKALDLHDWNSKPWVAAYGPLAKGLVFFAEDVFGDQYAFRYRKKSARPTLAKFWCEGGKVEESGAASFQTWLERFLSRQEQSVDWSLAAAAFRRGLKPKIVEHLSFALPLITGGNDELSNLEILKRDVHLHILGQLSLRIQSLPEGASIEEFQSEN